MIPAFDAQTRVVNSSSFGPLTVLGPLTATTGGTSASAYETPTASSVADVITEAGPLTSISNSVGRIVIDGPDTMVALRPIVLGADNTTAEYRVWRIHKVVDPSRGGSDPDRFYWHRELACIISAIGCARTGAGGPIPSAWRFCDSLAISGEHGLATGLPRSTQPAGGADNTPAEVIIDAMGANAIEVECKIGTATRAHCLFRTLNNG